MRRVSYYSAGQNWHRRDQRYRHLTLQVTVGHEHFRSLDWSMGGIRIDGIPEGVGIGDEVALSFAGTRRGQQWSATVPAVVVRIDWNRRYTAFHYPKLPSAAFDALEALITGTGH